MNVRRGVAPLLALVVLCTATYGWPRRPWATTAWPTATERPNRIDNLKFPTSLPPGVTPKMAERLAPVAFYTQFLAFRGATLDKYGGVIIVGGSTRGPFTSGGAAACKIALAENTDRVSLRISNGHHWGKGVHSTTRGGTLKIYMNDQLVHTVVADTRGLYGDYWPRSFPAGSNAYHVPEIDLKKMGVRGPWVIVKLVAGGGTCMDVESVRLLPVEAK